MCDFFFGFACLKAFSLMGSHTLTVEGKPQIGKDLNAEVLGLFLLSGKIYSEQIDF